MWKIKKFKSFDFGEFEITKREILASISDCGFDAADRDTDFIENI